MLSETLFLQGAALLQGNYIQDCLDLPSTLDFRPYQWTDVDHENRMEMMKTLESQKRRRVRYWGTGGE